MKLKEHTFLRSWMSRKYFMESYIRFSRFMIISLKPAVKSSVLLSILLLNHIILSLIIEFFISSSVLLWIWSTISAVINDDWSFTVTIFYSPKSSLSTIIFNPPSLSLNSSIIERLDKIIGIIMILLLSIFLRFYSS